MIAASSPPLCPGCDRPTVARRIGEVVRWACLTPGCPIVDLGPAVPRRPARRLPEPPAGPSLLLDDEPFH